MEKVFGLESGNGFLFEPDLCKSYYADLKSKISANSEIPYVFKYLFLMENIRNIKYNIYAEIFIFGKY